MRKKQTNPTSGYNERNSIILFADAAAFETTAAEQDERTATTSATDAADPDDRRRWQAPAKRNDARVPVVPRGGRIESVEGLVSIDRSVVAALLSTTPRA